VATVRARGKLAASLLTQIAAPDLLCTVACNSTLRRVLNSAQSDPVVARLELDHSSKSSEMTACKTGGVGGCAGIIPVV
jgi:hypothetical protein